MGKWNSQCEHHGANKTANGANKRRCCTCNSDVAPGFYTYVNFWGSLGLNFDYDGGPIIFYG